MDKDQFRAWKKEMDTEDGDRARLDTLCKDMECLKKDIEELKKVEPCPECGKKIPSDSLHCPYCKAEFEQDDN